MPQFVIEREIPGAGSLSEAQIREVSLRSLATLKEMGPKIQWLHSYVTEDKLYCVYLAPDEKTIREHYSRWVPERQARLSKILQEAFADKPRPNAVAIR